MGTGDWIVVALARRGDHEPDEHDISAAGPFPDRAAAEKFAAECGRDDMGVTVAQLYLPALGAHNFVIGDR
jgi:hypothetical protein